MMVASKFALQPVRLDTRARARASGSAAACVVSVIVDRFTNQIPTPVIDSRQSPGLCGLAHRR